MVWTTIKNLWAADNFTPTDNAGNVYSGELNKPQKAKAQQALAYLIDKGCITNGEVFELFRLTDGRKLFTEWREKGYLRAANDKSGYDWVHNSNGGKHKVHYWTGVKPAVKGNNKDITV